MPYADGGCWHMGSHFGWIMMIVFWAAILFLAYLAFTWAAKNRPGHGGGSGGETPLDTLKKRLAKGEIGEEEFDRLKKKLHE